MIGGMIGKHRLAIVVQLALAHAIGQGQVGQGGGAQQGDLGQGAVLEDDVGRHALLGGGRSAPGAQGFEQGLLLGRQGGLLAALLARPAGAGCGVEGLGLIAHFHLAFAAIDLPHGLGVAQADQGPIVVGVFLQQAFEQ